jgi:hypothetical protein
MNPSNRTFVAHLLLVLLSVVSPFGFADKPRFGDTITVSLGGMEHSGKAQIAVTRPDRPTDKLSFTDLGLDDETQVFWGDFNWQFAERWKFRLNYSSFDASGERVAIVDGNYEDIDWTVGARLTTGFELGLYIADVTWDFLKTDRGHLGVGLGVHAADINLDLLVEVGGQIGGEGGVVEVGQESNSLLAPLPNLSLAGGYQFGDQLYVSGSIGFLSLSYDKYDGELFSARGAVEWRPWRHGGVGLAYQYIKIDLDIEQSNKNELYDFDFYGPVLFVSVGF